MIRWLLLASVCTSMVGWGAPATAAPAQVASSDRATPVKKVVREYGAGSVAVAPGQTLVLRFKGERGDRVRLGSELTYRGKAYYGSVYEEDVSLRGRRRMVKPGVDGFFRLRETGRFTLRYDNPTSDAGAANRVQLFKQVSVTHDGRGTTRLPRSRGIQYVATLRAPRSGINVVSFGEFPYGLVTKGQRAHRVASESLVLAPGLPVQGADPLGALTKPLKPGQRVMVQIDPSYKSRISTSVPREAGAATLDGPAVKLPGDGNRAILADLAAADLEASAQRLLNVRLVGEKTGDYWSVLVLPPSGGIARPSAPGFFAYPGEPLYQLTETTGTYRILVFTSSHKAEAGEFELDSVVDGGTIAVDGGDVSVAARADGRYTLLDITQPEKWSPSWLSVGAVTVPGRWVVYAGSLALPDCSGDAELGCGDDSGTSVSTPATHDGPQRGGYVLTMPVEDQTTGSFSMRLTGGFLPPGRS